jgi:tRNA-dihydrouridine synthase B
MVLSKSTIPVKGEPVLRIGMVTIPNQVVLAPMAGITDKPFRLIAREHGCGLVYTEMISAKALTYENVKTKALLDLVGEKQPIAVQLFGCEPEVMAQGAVIAYREGAQIIDVNMGLQAPIAVLFHFLAVTGKSSLRGYSS